MNWLRDLLQHPLTRGLSVDDPQTTALRLKIIRDKKFLKKIYEEWYFLILSELTEREHVLELGSGAGFFDECLPNVITSEILPSHGVRMIVDACEMPFDDDCLDAITMTDVLHHIPNVSAFFTEACRTLKAGGKIIMVEPWNTPLSRWIYQNLHHEPFDPAGDWSIPNSGPLSGANGALPWIIFERDRAKFEQEFSKLKIQKIKPMMPICYLVSAGVSLRSFVPGALYMPVRLLEKMIPASLLSMFALIVIQKA